MTCGSRRGFTLIELLVVIAIIAILSAILFPVFAQARDKSRSAACLSNLRQMSAAVSMYTQDYEAYPLYEGAEGARWHLLLEPYMRSRAVVVCPSAAVGYDLRNMSYGYNHQYLARSESRGGPGGFPETAIEFPADTIAIADSAGTGGWSRGPLPWAPSPDNDCSRRMNHGYTIDPPFLPAGSRWGTSCAVPAPLPGYPGAGHTRVADRHQGGANVAFCDGHAKWLTRDPVERDNSLWNGRRQPGP
jgi:prepilin-type N-terminal cleavage/methylation domain-containing protein/prepilin-type processing-associated H-X9-DG protein